MRKLILIDSDGTLRKTNGDITENTKKKYQKINRTRKLCRNLYRKAKIPY